MDKRQNITYYANRHKSKQLSSKKNSPKKSPTKTESSPTKNLHHELSKKKIKQSILNYETYIQIQLKELRSSQQTTKKTLEMNNLLIKQNLPPRCAIHNNTLSLFCLYQKKLLCVNCIYDTKSNKHKSHKVKSLKDNTNEIEKQNQRLSEIIQKQYLRIKNQQNTISHNIKSLQNFLFTTQADLKKDYQLILKQVQTKYALSKKIINETIGNLINKNKQLDDQYKWISKIYQQNKNYDKTYSNQIFQCRKNQIFNELQDKYSNLSIKSVQDQEINYIFDDIFAQFQKLKRLIFEIKL